MAENWQYTQPMTFRPTVDNIVDEIARSADTLVAQGFWPISVRVIVETYPRPVGARRDWWKVVTRFRVERKG